MQFGAGLELELIFQTCFGRKVTATRPAFIGDKLLQTASGVSAGPDRRQLRTS